MSIYYVHLVNNHKITNAWSDVSKKVIVCSWKNLRPSMYILFEQYKNKIAVNRKDDEDNNFNIKLHQLQVDVAENVCINDCNKKF